VDASKYIKKLKQKVEKINNATTSEQSFRESSDPNPMVQTNKLPIDAFLLRSID